MNVCANAVDGRHRFQMDSGPRSQRYRCTACDQLARIDSAGRVQLIQPTYHKPRPDAAITDRAINALPGHRHT